MPSPTSQRPHDMQRIAYLDNLRASLVLLLVVDYATTQTLAASIPSQSESSSLIAGLQSVSALSKTFVAPTLFAVSGYSSFLSRNHRRRSLTSFVSHKTLRLLLPGLLGLSLLLPQSPLSSLSGAARFASFQNSGFSSAGVLFSRDLPYILRLYTYDITYTLLLLLKSNSPIDFPFTLPPTLYAISSVVFGVFTIRSTEGSMYWLSLPAYIAGINYFPQLHQRFTELASDVLKLPSSATLPSSRPRCNAKFTPKRQAQVYLLTSTLLSLLSLLVLHLVFPSSNLLLFASPASASNIHQGSSRALTTYAIWVSTSSLALSTSLTFLFGVTFTSSPSPPTHHQPPNNTKPDEADDLAHLLHTAPFSFSFAKTWLTRACTRYVYLQAYLGCLVVDAYLHFLLPQGTGTSIKEVGREVVRVSAMAVVNAWGVQLLGVLGLVGVRMVRSQGRS